MKKCLVVTLVLPFSVSAVAMSGNTCTPDLAVYFGNGMMTSETDGQTSTRFLRAAVKERAEGTPLEGDERIKVAHAYNPSVSFVDDLLESAVQDLQLNEIQFWEYMSGVTVMPDAFLELFKLASLDANARATTASPAVQEHVDLYNGYLREGRRVVLVGHSQGNLFGNIAYRNVDSDYRSAFGLVAVGTPSDHVAGGGQYTTLTEDIIISNVPGALPPNFSNFTFLNPSDLSGHEFLRSYFISGRPAKDRIIDHIFSKYADLEIPENVLQAGAFTATLRWGSEPDIDLHVFEPNGSHVYYSSKQGQAGFLDRDDTSGYGPEHYTLPCENIEAGTYRVGVNYYRGEGPETASVSIVADGYNEIRYKTLSSAIGSDGDSSPSIIYEVTISGSEDEGYSYVVE